MSMYWTVVTNCQEGVAEWYDRTVDSAVLCSFIYMTISSICGSIFHGKGVLRFQIHELTTTK